MGTRIDAPAGSAHTDGPRSPPPVAQVPGGAGAAGGLDFPDVPLLELDELLVQLVDRAGDVLAAQGQLRGLLRANALVAGDLTGGAAADRGVCPPVRGAWRYRPRRGAGAVRARRHERRAGREDR
jgi:hypothetical protein